MTRSDTHLDQAALQKAIEFFYDNNPFTKDLGLVIENVNNGDVVVSLKIAHRHTNMHKITHGGVLMSLADTAMGAACLSINRRVVTLDFNINMIKSVPENVILKAKTNIVHSGQQTIVAECAIFNDKDDLCCKSRATFFVLGPLQE